MHPVNFLFVEKPVVQAQPPTITIDAPDTSTWVKPLSMRRSVTLQGQWTNPLADGITGISLTIGGQPIVLTDATVNNASSAGDSWSVTTKDTHLIHDQLTAEVTITTAGGQTKSAQTKFEVGIDNPMQALPGHPNPRATEWTVGTVSGIGSPQWVPDAAHGGTTSVTSLTGFAGGILLNEHGIKFSKVLTTSDIGEFWPRVQLQHPNTNSRSRVRVIVDSDERFNDTDTGHGPTFEDNFTSYLVPLPIGAADVGKTLTMEVSGYHETLGTSVAAELPFFTLVDLYQVADPNVERTVRIARSESIILGTEFQTYLSNLVASANTNGGGSGSLYESQYAIEAMTNHWVATGNTTVLTQVRDFVDNMIGKAGADNGGVTQPRDSSTDFGMGVRPQTGPGATQTEYKGWRNNTMLEHHHFGTAVLRLCWEIITQHNRSADLPFQTWALNRSEWAQNNVAEAYLTGGGLFNAGINFLSDSAVTRVVDPNGASGFWSDKLWLAARIHTLADAIDQHLGRARKAYYVSKLDASQRIRGSYLDVWLDDFLGISTGNTPATSTRASGNKPRINPVLYYTDQQGRELVNWDVNVTAPGSNHNSPGEPDSHGPDVSHANRVASWIEDLIQIDDHSGNTFLSSTRRTQVLRFRAALVRTMHLKAGAIVGQRAYISNYLDGSNDPFRASSNLGPSTSPTTNRNAGAAGYPWPGWCRWANEASEWRDILEALLAAAEEYHNAGKPNPVNLGTLTKYGDYSTARSASVLGRANLASALI